MKATRLIRALGSVFAMVFVLTGCTLPGSASYFKHTVNLVIDGQPYSFSHAYACEREVQPSEGPQGPLYVRTVGSGNAFVAVPIGTRRVLFYYLSADCGGATLRPLNSPVEILEMGDRYVKISIIHDEFADSIVSEKRIQVEPLEGRPDHLGPSLEEDAYTRSVISHYEHKFKNVVARAIPSSIWAASEQSRSYFRGFASVVAAKEGEAEHVMGSASYLIQFRHHTERKYPRDTQQSIAGLRDMELPFAQGGFDLVDRTPTSVRTFYSEAGMDDSRTVVVRRKSVAIDVGAPREVFDPSNQMIYLMIPSVRRNLGELLAVDGTR